MQEIFDDISEQVRSDIYDLFSVIAHMTDFLAACKLITLYRNTLSEREQEFMDFVFRVYMEEHNINESDIDQR